MPWARVFTIAAVVVAVPMLALGVAGLVVHPTVAGAGWVALSLVGGLPALGLGLLVNRRFPDNAVGPLLGFAGVMGLDLGLSAYDAAVLASPGALPFHAGVVSLTQGSWMLLYLPFAGLLLVYPTGRLMPGTRWRLIAAGLPTVVVAFSLLASLGGGPVPPYGEVPSPLGTWPPATDLALSLLPVLLVLLLACLVAALLRFRRADRHTRLQMRWLVMAATTVPLTLLLCWASYLLTGSTVLVDAGLVVMYVALPTGAAIGLLRPRLYDVDQALVSTIVLGALTAGLVMVFTLASVAAARVFGPDGTLAAVVVTALCFLLVGPARSRLDSWVGRWVHPARERTLASIADLTRRVHAGDSEPEQLEGVLRTALDEPMLRVGYLLPGSDELVDGDGAAVLVRPGTAELELGGEPVGVLTGLQEPAPSGVCEAAAPLAEMVRLRAQLAQALREVEASRGRILRAGLEERRRLERDLHDGAQQRLVALGMSLRLLQRADGAQSAPVVSALDQAVAEIQASVSELRQIAHGLRPSSLDDGLDAALTNLARLSPVPVELDLEPTRVSDAAGTTAYFVASEAITNALRYAGDCRIRLRVSRDGDQVLVRVTDDGCGGAVLRPGAGLASLRDRVAAAGGSLTVSSTPGAGTTVEAALPCGS